MNLVVKAREAKFIPVFSIGLFIASCAAPQYDSAADKSIGDIQREIHVQIDNWISGLTKLEYTPNKKFYDDVDSDLKSLEIRMESTPESWPRKSGQ